MNVYPGFALAAFRRHVTIIYCIYRNTFKKLKFYKIYYISFVNWLKISDVSGTTCPHQQGLMQHTIQTVSPEPDAADRDFPERSVNF
jgi:hypothetical protein